jgi:hypothetical protein
MPESRHHKHCLESYLSWFAAFCAQVYEVASMECMSYFLRIFVSLLWTSSSAPSPSVHLNMTVKKVWNSFYCLTINVLNCTFSWTHLFSIDPDADIPISRGPVQEKQTNLRFHRTRMAPPCVLQIAPSFSCMALVWHHLARKNWKYIQRK